MKFLSAHQFDLLQGFRVHLVSAYQYGGVLDGNFFAEQLDKAKIPWSLQNSFANLFVTKKNNEMQTRTLLNNLGFQVLNS